MHPSAGANASQHHHSIEKHPFKHRILDITDPSVHQVLSARELRQVWQLRRSVYQNLYTEITEFENDPHDPLSVIFYHAQPNGKIDGTLRCALDAPKGLPDEALFVPQAEGFRSKGFTLAEAGRTAVLSKTPNTQVIQSLYSALHTAVTQLKIDIVLMAVPQSKVRFHQKIWDTEILNVNTGCTFGSAETFATLAWHVARTRPHFFHWIQKSASASPASLVHGETS